jgi:kynurenine formamidase
MPSAHTVLSGSRWIDLSLLVSDEHPSFPASMPFKHNVWAFHSDQWPYYTAWWAIDEHTGTHFDAPAHFVPPEGSGRPFASAAGSITGDQVPLDQLRGPARVIDVRRLDGQADTGKSPMIEPEHVLEHEREHGEIEPGDVVIFWTGWDRHWQTGEAGRGYFADVVQGRSPGWTSPTVETSELLVSRGVRCLATDAASIGSVDDATRTHVAGLANGMVFVEAVTNLEQLPPRGAYFLFLPVYVKGTSGGPGRAVAIVTSTGDES